MKRLKSICLGFVLILSPFFLITACTQTVDPDPTQLIGRWQLTKVVYEDSTIEKTNPYKGRYEVEIEFSEDGKIKGTTSSNTIAGTYSVSDTDSIKIIHSLESKVGENSWGRYFNNGIPIVKTYSLENKLLHLNFQDNTLIFIKVK